MVYTNDLLQRLQLYKTWPINYNYVIVSIFFSLEYNVVLNCL